MREENHQLSTDATEKLHRWNRHYDLALIEWRKSGAHFAQAHKLACEDADIVVGKLETILADTEHAR